MKKKVKEIKMSGFFLRIKRFMKKIPQGKILAVLVAIPVIEGALFGYLYLGHTQKLNSVKADYDTSFAMLQSLPKTDYVHEMQVQNDALDQAQKDTVTAGNSLVYSLEPTQIYHDLYALAATSNVTIIAVTSAGMSEQLLNKYSFNMLPLDLNVQGTIAGINEFMALLPGGFHTATIKSVFITPDDVYQSTDVFADMSINIYSYRGNTNE